MTSSDIQNTIREIVAGLVNEDYQKVFDNDYRKIGTVEELKAAVEDYPGHISFFPDSAFELMRLYRHTDAECDVDFPLWYDGQRSDLTLVCNLRMIDGKIRLA